MEAEESVTEIVNECEFSFDPVWPMPGGAGVVGRMGGRAVGANEGWPWPKVCREEVIPAA